MKKFILNIVLICVGVFGVSSTIIAMTIDKASLSDNPFQTLTLLFGLMFIVGLGLAVYDILKNKKKNIQ